MTAARLIYLDDAPIEDKVTVAIVPVSTVTGAIVRRGVTAKITGLPNRPLLNGSGMLVFINLPARDDPFEILLDATEAGYFSPPPIPFTPPQPDDPARESKLRAEVLLLPLPDFPFPSATTLVRGVVVRGATPVAGAEIVCRPVGGADFAGRSGGRGAFACALRLPPPPTPDRGIPKTFKVMILVSEGGDLRELVIQVARGRSHSFKAPIDLTGASLPGLFTI